MKTPLLLSASALSMLCSDFALAQDISGRISNSNGEPIANAQIKVVNQSQRTQSDENGYYNLKGLVSGPIELHITAAMYIHSNESVKVGANDLEKMNWTLEKSVIEIIDVFATPLHSSIIESALPINVIGSDELRTKQSSTLGETLKNEIGVHSTYYGPVASSPIIRGLDGPRVLITQNGLDVSDASRVGPDHIVATETSTAEQIEVLRGPSTLFYGSGAIGGVVNVVDKRVPRAVEQEIDYSLKHNNVADENEASVNINSGQGDVAFHFDAFWRESNDYKIPGEASTEEEHDDHEGEHEEHEEEENNGRLANSAAKSNGFTIGSSYILDKGFIGFSYGQMNREYGIPGHGHHGEEHGEEEHEDHDEEGHEEHEGEEHDDNVYGDLEQQRWQLLSEYSLDSDWLTQIKSKLSYTDYQHQEIEGGEIGTLFENKMSEARFDIYHKEFSGWQGAWTLHHKRSDFKAVGEEAFTPPSKTTTSAVAWLVEKHFDDVLWQVGARLEHVDIKTNSLFVGEEHDEDDGHDEDHEGHEEYDNSYQESFTPISASVGLVWDYQKGYNVGFSASFAQRAPSASEIFSNGPHIGTNTYEVGTLYEVEVHEGEAEIHFDEQAINNELETSYSLDLTWRKFTGDLGIIASVFYNQFDNYYYLANTGLFFEDPHGHDEGHDDDHDEGHDDDHDDGHEGDHDEDHEGDHEEEEGLPIYNYQQQSLDMYGVELELVYKWSSSLTSTLFTDYTQTKLDDGGYLPRMPPLRIGGGLMYQGNDFYAEFNVRHYFEQDKVANLETSTDSYTIMDAHANYYLQGFGDDTVLFLKIDNIADTEARVHTSFLKNDAPLPGRGISFGIRGSF